MIRHSRTGTYLYTYQFTYRKGNEVVLETVKALSPADAVINLCLEKHLDPDDITGFCQIMTDDVLELLLKYAREKIDEKEERN